ncbi:MAG: hypothetical protein AAB783_02100 [Patescibacteria group bacterium]
MIDSRHKNILEILVREYIKTAEPVSSEKIASRMRHSLSSASVRNIFSDLTDEGYIEQPYVSGGRIPRSRGYRFFVDELLSGGAREAIIPQALLRLCEEESQMREATRLLQEEIAHQFRVLSQFGTTMPIGFDQVLREPEFEEPSVIKEFGRFLDEFNESRDEYNDLLTPDSYQLFIGDENNIQPHSRMSVVVGKDADAELFFIAGPTRMPYDLIIGFMKIWKKSPLKIKK